jgi:hypothetical protein
MNLENQAGALQIAKRLAHGNRDTPKALINSLSEGICRCG